MNFDHFCGGNLGQGKFSYVFKARNVQTKKIVAMKLIKIFDMDNEKQRDSCLKEVQLHQVCKLYHPLY